MALTSEFITTLLNFGLIFSKSSNQRQRRELNSSNACSFQCSLLVFTQVFHLFVDHLLDIVGNTNLDVFDIHNNAPLPLLFRDQSRRNDEVNGINHKERIPVCAFVNQSCQSSWEHIPCKSR